ncbi:MAG: SGNH/GDSL hydrolase family protein [Planctomycetes bacterium]|nr:SGNH/GDSL hydrolase family protein [Planctomycetota bacterium]
MTPGEKRLVALLASSTLTLLAACVFLVLRLRATPVAFDTNAALADPELRNAVVQRLATQATAIWDSHNDPEVGRMLQPNLREVQATGVPTSTNVYGLRERPFELPKPPGTLRVVILGDSFVQGFGVLEAQRMGVLLERYLTEHATGFSGRIECLHIGVGGWNAVNECAYLRRMLSELAPDLVLHVLVTNDLDDECGVRGFGALSAFAPLVSARTDAMVYHAYPTRFSSPLNTNYLLEAADFESRQRYEELAEALGRLALCVRRSGARYVAVAQWSGMSARLWSFLEPHLPREEYAPLPTRLMTDPDLRLGPTDAHWSVTGHEQVARLFFALIRGRGLLPQLALTPWPEVEETALKELEAAWREATRKQRKPVWMPVKEAVSRLEPAHFTDLEWRHVYTGLDDQARVSPFASFYLAPGELQYLVLRGRAFARPELAGARVQVSVEGQPLGEHELVPGEPFELRLPLPADLRRDGGINVRLETNDYVYANADRQHCVSFQLDLLALE